MSSRVYQCPNCEYQLPKEQPIVSYGIVGIRVIVPEITQDQLFDLLNASLSIRSDNDRVVEAMATMEDRVKFLLVRRKSSLGLSSIVRGKYNNGAPYSIIKLIRQLTDDDLHKLKNVEFYDLWKDVCGRVYDDQYSRSYEKFKRLFDVREPINIDYYTSRYKPLYESQEWGIPKGRKSKGETQLECAVREFKEETGIQDSSHRVMTDVHPKSEDFKASDGRVYRHVYYTSLVTGEVGSVDKREIGDIRWVQLPQALSLVRHDKYDRVNILTSTYYSVVRALYNEGIGSS